MVAADLYTMTYGLASANHLSRETVASIQASMKEQAKCQPTNGHSNETVVGEKSVAAQA